MKLWTIVVAVLLYVASVVSVAAAEEYEAFPQTIPSWMAPSSPSVIPPKGERRIVYNVSNPPAWLEGSTLEEKTASFEEVMFEVLEKIKNDPDSDFTYSYTRTSGPCSHTEEVNVFLYCWEEAVSSNDGVHTQSFARLERDGAGNVVAIVRLSGTVQLSRSYNDVPGFDKYLRMRLFRGTLQLLGFPKNPNSVLTVMRDNYPDLTDFDRRVLGYLLPARDASCLAFEAGRRSDGRLFVTTPYVWVGSYLYGGTFEQQPNGLFAVVGKHLADKWVRTCALAYEPSTQTLRLPDVVYQPTGQHFDVTFEALSSGFNVLVTPK